MGSLTLNHYECYLFTFYTCYIMAYIVKVSFGAVIIARPVKTKQKIYLALCVRDGSISAGLTSRPGLIRELLFSGKHLPVVGMQKVKNRVTWR